MHKYYVKIILFRIVNLPGALLAKYIMLWLIFSKSLTYTYLHNVYINMYLLNECKLTLYYFITLIQLVHTIYININEQFDCF